MLQNVPEEAIEQVKTNLHIAIQTAPDWSKAWHSWALFNAQMLEYYARTDQERAQRHVAPAVAGFFKSVALGQANQMPGESRPPYECDALKRYWNVLALQVPSDLGAAHRELLIVHALPLANLICLADPAGEPAKGSNLQDILRLLTLWFTHGSAPDVERALEEGFGHISIDTWLVIIPQVCEALTCNLMHHHSEMDAPASFAAVSIRFQS